MLTTSHSIVGSICGQICTCNVLCWVLLITCGKGALQGNLVVVVQVQILCFSLLLGAAYSFGEAVIPIKDLPSEKNMYIFCM